MKAEINITPLVDVALVLLIIFMVVTPLLKNDGIPLQLPYGQNPNKTTEKPEELTISIDGNSRIFINRSLIDGDRFANQIQAVHASDPQKVILLKADRRLNYRIVRRVLDDVCSAGFQNLRVIAEKQSVE